MTTNGTLMTEDVIEFLVKYEFNLMISLDGDKKSHDINRRFKTGKGSFDIILENLSRLKAYNEEYYSKVLFNCVISSSSDLENIYRFYSEEELFEAGTVNFNYVNPVGLKDETLSRITQKNFRVHRLAYIKMILSVLEKRKWDAQSRLLRRELQDIGFLALYRYTDLNYTVLKNISDFVLRKYNTPVKEYILSRQFYKADHEWKKIRYYTMEDMNEKPAIPENSEYQVLDIFDDTKIEKEILKILEELANNIFVI